MSVRSVSGDRGLVSYFVIAYLIPLIAAVFVFLKDGLQTALVTTQVSGLAIVVLMAMVHAPTIAAIVVALANEGLKGVRDLFGQLKRWRFKAGWYLLALLTFPLAIIVALLLLPAFSLGGSLAVALSIFAVASLLSALWEEIGWTGYATPRMLRRFSPLQAGLLLGLIHAFWHLAADYWGASAFFGDFYRFAAHFLLSLAGIVVLRVIIVWIYTRTQSLVLGWLAHYGYTGGQLLLTTHLTAPQTLVWNSIFVAVLALSLAVLAATSKDFRDFLRSRPAAEAGVERLFR